MGHGGRPERLPQLPLRGRGSSVATGHWLIERTAHGYLQLIGFSPPGTVDSLLAFPYLLTTGSHLPGLHSRASEQIAMSELSLVLSTMYLMHSS